MHAGPVSGGAQFLVHSQHHLAVFSHGGRARSNLGSLTGALSPLIEAPPSWPDPLPEAPHPHTIILGVRVSTYELGRDTNVQSMADIHVFFKHLRCGCFCDMCGLLQCGTQDGPLAQF